MLDKPSRLTEKELAEAASKWAAEKLEKADESNLPDIEYEVRHNFLFMFHMKSFVSILSYGWEILSLL